MSRETIPVLQCDRCGEKCEVRAPGQDARWGHVMAHAPAVDPACRPRTTGSAPTADLCPRCVDDFFAWWTSPPPRAVSDPTPELGQPAQTRRPRRHMTDIIDRALREQVAESLDAVREQPTSILNGEIVPGALEGVEMRARRVARELEGEA